MVDPQQDLINIFGRNRSNCYLQTLVQVSFSIFNDGGMQLTRTFQNIKRGNEYMCKHAFIRDMLQYYIVRVYTQYSVCNDYNDVDDSNLKCQRSLFFEASLCYKYDLKQI